MTAHIEFWWEFGSNYSYLSAMRIEDLARARGVRVEWRPFLLGPIFRSFGWDTSPFVLQKEKGRYVWQDMARQCRKYGLPWKQPSEFPRIGVLAARIALLGETSPWIGAFTREVMLRNFARDQGISDEASLRPILQGLGLDADETIAAAQTQPQRDAMRERIAQATQRGIFGAPTFFVGDEMFWGNDRLDDALEFAAQHTG
jgi:2-hydroxychromene-2-carboxylate isomerase